VDTYGISYCRLARPLLAPQFYPYSNEQTSSTHRSLVFCDRWHKSSAVID